MKNEPWRMTIRQRLANFLWNWKVVYDVTYDWIMLFFHRRLVYIGRLYHLWQKVIKKSLVPFGHSVIFLDYFFGHSWYNRQYTLVSGERTLHFMCVVHPVRWCVHCGLSSNCLLRATHSFARSCTLLHLPARFCTFMHHSTRTSTFLHPPATFCKFE